MKFTETNHNKVTASPNSTKFPQGLEVFISEKDKYENDKEYLKQLVNYYDLLGRSQVAAKKKNIQDLRDLANGVINKDDFINSEEIRDLKIQDPSIKFDEDEIELEFFPIAPNILHRLVGELDKKYLKFYVRAVNSEAKNEIIEKRNEELLTILKEQYTATLQGQNIPEEELQAMIEDKFKYYASDYKSEIEMWAAHLMEFEDQKFNIRKLERDLFKENLIHEEPFVHINYQDNHYYPEIWQPEDVFFLKSKHTEDASDYIMIGKYSYLDINTILNKYTLSEEQLEIIQDWQTNYTSSLAVNGTSNMEGYGFSHKESLQNYLAFKSIGDSDRIANRRVIRETYMYMLVPKKVGVLTTIIDGQVISVEVDETFKVTNIPKYSHKDKGKEYLISGEHVEWTYINELFQVVKLDPDYSGTYLSDNQHNKSLWIKLAPHDIQYKHRFLRYGVKIPVHGGSVLGWSITSRIKPWQKFFNYIWNRNKQIASNEVGKFLLLNQNIIPQTSYDGDWGEHNLLKAFLSARDISIMPTDTSLTNVGQLQAGAGMGQVIDLEKTNEIINKAQLANMIKQECYDSIGLNPQFLADISPYQSAKSVAQGLQVTITQLQYLYSKHYDVMKAVRETMIETALFLTSKGEMRELTYVNTDGQRVIFNLGVSHTLLYDLGLFLNSNPNDVVNLELIKQIALNDNTMGSDAFEKMQIITSDTITEMSSKLKENVLKRNQEIQAQRQHEQEMLDKQIEAKRVEVEKQIFNANREAQLDREYELEGKRIAALGYANDTADIISTEIKEMSEFNLKQRALEDTTNYNNLKLDLERQKLDMAQNKNDGDLNLKERMELEKLKLREKELAENVRRNNILAKKPKTK